MSRNDVAEIIAAALLATWVAVEYPLGLLPLAAAFLVAWSWAHR